MFKICVNCDSLCVLIILSIGLCSSLAIQDRERLLYESDFKDDDVTADLRLLSLPLERARRQIPPQMNVPAPPAPPGTTGTTGTTGEVHHQVDEAPRSTLLQNVDNRSGGGGGDAPPLTSLTPGGAGGGATGTTAVVRDNHQPLARPQTTAVTAPVDQQMVGVNGTGQHWTNVTAAVSSNGGATKTGGGAPPAPPTVVSEPINPTANVTGGAGGAVVNGGATITNNSEDTAARLPEDINDATLAMHNITTNKTDSHEYYNSTIVVDADLGQKYWNEFASSERLNSAQVSELLSSSHRRAVTVQLSFSFPFYGHPVRNVTVATGGFLYTGDYVHSWLAATQYIAPLMANFDTSLSNNSFVKFYDNGTAFTVLWENVSLQDRPSDGSFTFSATLLDTGDIIFVYKTIPVLVEKIEDNKHPVKVGLSDAYIIDRTVFFTRRKTIYEYHRVQFRQEDIKNWTTVHLKALPTCVLYTDCEACLKQSTAFMCAWCPATNRCSSGMDRHRQEWLSKGCNLTQIRAIDQCPAIGSRGNNATVTSEPPMDNNGASSTTVPTSGSADNDAYDTHSGHRAAHHSARPISSDSTDSGSGTTSSGGVVAVLVPLCLIVAIAGWLLYAYRNPHTKSGQMLIRYRPSTWTWRRGEARYTAATIHM